MRCIPVSWSHVLCVRNRLFFTEALEPHTHSKLVRHKSKAAVFNVIISSSIKTEERVSPVWWHKCWQNVDFYLNSCFKSRSVVGKLWICTESEWFCSNLSVSLDSSSSEKTRALHEQLDSLQTLREQLEETLARSRETALAVDRAALVQADYGGGARQSLASGPAGGADTNLNEALVEHEGS